MVVEKLLSWHSRLSQRTRFVSTLEVYESYAGFGIRTNSALSLLQIIIKVPKCGWIEFSADSCVQDVKRMNPQLHKRLCDITATFCPSPSGQSNNLLRASCMAMKLIADSKIKLNHPYVDFLNKTTRCPSAMPHPFVMTSQELDGADFLLAGSNSHRAIAKRRVLYQFIGESIFGEHVSAIDEFKWAMGIVYSRAISNASIGTPLTLVPVIDLVNHSSTKCNAEHKYDPTTGDFSLFTTKPIEAGDEIFINYGNSKDSASFMALYGFCDVDNLNDELTLNLSSTYQISGDYSKEILASSGEMKESQSSFIEWKNLATERYKTGITTASAEKKSDGTTLLEEKVTNVIIGTPATVPLHFLQSLDRELYESIVVKLLEKESESQEDVKRRIQLCDEVVVATQGALGDFILLRARGIVASHLSLITLCSGLPGAGLVGASDTVETEISAVKIVLLGIDQSILSMLSADSRAEYVELNEVFPASITMYHVQGRPTLLAYAEKRLLYLQQVANLPHSIITSPRNFYWRRNSAAISYQELDGLVRLRLLFSAYHIALLTSQ